MLSFEDHIVSSILRNDRVWTALEELPLLACHLVTNDLKELVTHTKVPLEVLNIDHCDCLCFVSLWNLVRFELKTDI